MAARSKRFRGILGMRTSPRESKGNRHLPLSTLSPFSLQGSGQFAQSRGTVCRCAWRKALGEHVAKECLHWHSLKSTPSKEHAGISTHLPSFPQEHAQICQIWGPGSGGVDFLPHWHSGRRPVEGLAQQQKRKAKFQVSERNCSLLFSECSGHFPLTCGHGGAKFLLSHPEQVSGSWPGCSTETNMSSYTNNSESSITLSLKVFGRWKETEQE